MKYFSGKIRQMVIHLLYLNFPGCSIKSTYRSLEKFTVGYFHVKFVRGEIFSFLGVSIE